MIAGAVQGYFGGWTDLLFQRFIEIWAGLPTLYLLIILASVVVPGFWRLLGLMLLFSWMAGRRGARRVPARAQLRLCARRQGAGRERLAHHVPAHPAQRDGRDPDLLPFILSGSVTTLTALDFLGFGLPPGSPSLGELLQQGKNNLQAPWLGLTGFFVIGGMLSLLVFVGEAVRDAFDPRKTFA